MTQSYIPIAITAFSVMTSLQITALITWLMSFIKPREVLSAQIYSEMSFLLRPEHETLIFRFFVLVAILMGAILYGLKVYPSRLRLTVESILTLIILSSAFKMLNFIDYPELARNVFLITVILSLIYKFFYIEIDAGLVKGWEKIEHMRLTPFIYRALIVVITVLIMAWIYIPDIQAALAKMFIGEQFHHNDSFIFAPGYAVSQGMKLNLDVISQYGMGMPVLIEFLTRLMGGFSHETALRVMVWMVMIYYACWFVLLRQWFKSIIWALIAIIWAIKLQMFHMGVYPLVFTYGSATPLRFFFDILFFGCIYQWITTSRLWWLVMAGVVVGLQIFYITSEGVYLMGAYVFLCILNGIDEWMSKKNIILIIRKIGLLVALALISAGVLLFMVYGKSVLDPQLWRNMGEFINYFLSGFGVTPIYTGLLERKYLAFLMGCIVPLVYTFSLLYSCTIWILNRQRKEMLLIAVLAVYGLGLYHYFVARSAANSYYTVALPYVVIIIYALKNIIEHFWVRWQQRFKWGGLIIALGSLLSTHMVMAYPNLFNLSPNPHTDLKVVMPLENGGSYFHHLFRDYNEQLKVAVNSRGNTNEGLLTEKDFKNDQELKKYYFKEIDFSKDVTLIQQLTPEASQIVLISSFEVNLLMQSNRKPLIYYYPLVISQPMAMRSLVRTSIYTKEQLSKVINQLETVKPAYVFVQKHFLIRPVPEHFYYYYSSFMYLTDYVLKHYQPFQEGDYLVALKRIAP